MLIYVSSEVDEAVGMVLERIVFLIVLGTSNVWSFSKLQSSHIYVLLMVQMLLWCTFSKENTEVSCNKDLYSVIVVFVGLQGEFYESYWFLILIFFVLGSMN